MRQLQVVGALQAVATDAGFFRTHPARNPSDLHAPACTGRTRSDCQICGQFPPRKSPRSAVHFEHRATPPAPPQCSLDHAQARRTGSRLRICPQGKACAAVPRRLIARDFPAPDECTHTTRHTNRTPCSPPRRHPHFHSPPLRGPLPSLTQVRADTALLLVLCASCCVGLSAPPPPAHATAACCHV